MPQDDERPPEPVLYKYAVGDTECQELEAYLRLSASKPYRDAEYLLSFLPARSSDGKNVITLPLSLSDRFDAARAKARDRHGMSMVQYYAARRR